ncbi:MAG: FAD-binding protein, partial [Ignavibacteriales bacterium]|nr:FAD-binding protein [Ignavibacteriales bacterium]
MNVEKDFSLKKFNTFGIDIKAKQFVAFHTDDELLNFLKSEEVNLEDILIIGGGSNILFTKDFNGTVLKSEIMGITELKIENDNIFLEVGSGVVWNDLVEYTVNKGYGGIENLTLIPGTVGAAPIQNIGAYGVEFEEVFEELEGIDLLNKRKTIYKKSQCNFGYRD